MSERRDANAPARDAIAKALSDLEEKIALRLEALRINANL